MKFVAGLAGMVLVLAACGEKDEKKDFSGSTGTCTYDVAEITFCTSYAYTAKAKKDPRADAVASVKGACDELSGTYAEAGTCSEDNSVGSCAVPPAVDGDATVTGSIVFSTPADATDEDKAVALSIAESACEEQEGTFTAKE